MKIKFLIAFSTMFLFFALVNLYIGFWNIRFLRSLNIKPNSIIYWTIFGLISMSYVFSWITEYIFPRKFNTAIAYVGYYWLGIMLYFCLFSAVVEFFRFLIKRYGFMSEISNYSRIINPIVGSLVLLMVVVILIYGTWNAEHPIVKTYDMNLPKKAGTMKSLNIALVTDIHIGKIIGNGRVINMVKQINSLNPDIVIIAGDFVDNGVEPFMDEKIVDTLRGIKAPLGTYAVPGNHDLMKGQLEKLVYYLESANIKMLIDSSIKVKESFYIVGRMDASSERVINVKRHDLKDLIKDVDKTLPIILVDHQPKDLDAAEKEGVDIQLSGHTHRGQLFPNQIFTRRIYEIDWGHLKKGNFNVIVSSGFGTWGPRLRIGNKAEVVNIKVSFTK